MDLQDSKKNSIHLKKELCKSCSGTQGLTFMKIFETTIEDLSTLNEVKHYLEEKISGLAILMNFTTTQFKSIFDTLIEGVQIIDLNWYYIYLNQSAIQHSRKKSYELLGNRLMDVYPDIEKSTLFQVLKDCMEFKKYYRIENEFEYPDKVKTWFELSIEPINEGILILSVDITEKKRIQEMEQAKKVAEETNKTKSLFLANMSHELRTPLNAIIGFSELLHQELELKLEKEQFDAINEILNASNHLKDLIDDLLDLSRIEAGQFKLDKKVFEIVPLINHSIKYFQEKVKKEKKIIDIIVPNSNNISIYADELRIRQVLINLLSNALKYTEQNGKISITLQELDNYFKISVSDNGIGIDKENISHLFQPFQRLDNAISHNIPGTGLGLNYSKKLIELHGGKIWVESELGKGSNFIFILPKCGE
jgi:PAS domain S-box-containing protein